MPSKPSRDLQTFPNPKPDRPFEIAMDCPEFTCVCPMTGQPDFAIIRLRYVPAERCVELKSLKLYLWSYRDEGAFHEAVTNKNLRRHRGGHPAALDRGRRRLRGPRRHPDGRDRAAR
ncbi:MAG: preQ(1) synthase [Anaeromyxobacteraceae bacterium]